MVMRLIWLNLDLIVVGIKLWVFGKINGPLQGPVAENPGKDLINFDGKGIYRSPEFVWNQTVGPSALKFLNSDKLGKQYRKYNVCGQCEYW